MGKLDQLKEWRRKYGTANVIGRVFHTLSPIQIVADNERIRRANWQAKCKKKLKKYLVFAETSETAPESHIIWWMWLQGSAQAPPLVRKCLQSVRQFAEKNGFQVVELNATNLFDYVQLPEIIVKKWKSGQMLSAHFSDMCRIDLIANRGGIWIDSTVLLTGVLEEEILASDAFFYRASFLDESETKMSNWFLYARTAGNLFYQSLYQSMLNFWKSERYPCDYFVFHLIAALLIESGKFQKELDEMPYYTNTYPTLLQHELNKPFQEDKFRSIISKTPVHKLTYKGLNEHIEGTFLSFLLKDTIQES